ncbi:MAG: ATP synthase F0 subunit B [Myxococcota bacterium]
MSRIAVASTAASAWLVVFATPALAWAAPHGDAHGADAHGGDAHSEGIVWVSDVVGNTGKTGLVFLLINFAILFYLLDKILFSKLRASTKTKHETVKGELHRATEAHQEAKAMVADYRARLDGLAKEAEEMLADAAERAEADRKRIIEAAEREAEQIRAPAKAAAERDAAGHRRRLEGEVIDRAVERAEQIIREKITAGDQRTMVDDYVGRLSSIDFSGNAKRKSTGAA